MVVETSAETMDPILPATDPARTRNTYILSLLHAIDGTGGAVEQAAADHLCCAFSLSAIDRCLSILRVSKEFTFPAERAGGGGKEVGASAAHLGVERGILHRRHSETAAPGEGPAVSKAGPVSQHLGQLQVMLCHPSRRPIEA